MRIRVLWLASVVSVLALLTMGLTLSQVNTTPDQIEWRLLRTVTTNDTPLTTATKVWSTVGSSSIFVPIPEGTTWVGVSAYAYGDGDGAGDPTAGTCNYTILGARRGSSAQIITTGAMAVGSLGLSGLPYSPYTALSGASSYAWVEGPPTASDTWLTAIQTCGTTNDIGGVMFATNGIQGFAVEITGMANVTSVSVVYVCGK
jgi:hypothetical protein